MRLGRKHRTRLAEIIDDCMVSEAVKCAGLIPTQYPGMSVASVWLGFAEDLARELQQSE